MGKTAIRTGLAPAVRFAEVEIDGQTYKLAFSIRAVAAVEQELGINLLYCIGKRELTTEQLYGQFYASLKLAHPEMTADMADYLISKGFNVAVKGLSEAYELSFNQPNPQKADVAAEG